MTCKHCGTEIYQRRRFGGATLVWVHGGPSITAPAVVNCPGAEPEEAK